MASDQDFQSFSVSQECAFISHTSRHKRGTNRCFQRSTKPTGWPRETREESNAKVDPLNVGIETGAVVRSSSHR